MFEYDPDVQKAAEQLDTYDFTDILIECYDTGERGIYEMIDKMSDRYPGAEECLAELSSDEFMEYLCSKYHVQFDEVITYKLWHNPYYRK